jgi:hypothetical protein
VFCAHRVQIRAQENPPFAWLSCTAIPLCRFWIRNFAYGLWWPWLQIALWEKGRQLGFHHDRWAMEGFRCSFHSQTLGKPQCQAGEVTQQNHLILIFM